MKTKAEVITPERAREILKGNTTNRNIRTRYVDALAGEMINGNWILTHQGIAIYEDGTLADGQHRLLAILQANRPIEILVTTGIPKKVPGRQARPQDVMDCGRARSVADQMTLHGETHASARAAAARMIASICTDFSRPTLSHTDVITVLNIYDDAILEAYGNLSKTKAHLRASWIIGSLAMSIHADERITEFVERLGSGENLSGESPILGARNWLIGLPIVGSSYVRGYVETLLQCVLAYLEGRPYPRPTRGRGGLTYILEKQKDDVARVRSIFSMQDQGAVNRLKSLKAPAK